jgi:hypothetical protein
MDLKKENMAINISDIESIGKPRIEKEKKLI